MDDADGALGAAPSGATSAAPPDAVGAVPLDELMQMAVIARRYYVDGETRLRIAEDSGLSRFKVARILEAAVRLGVVSISIEVPASVDAVASLRLRDRYGLRQAVVVSPHDQRPEGLRDALGRATALLMSEVLTARDVLGVSSGRTIDAAARHLRALPRCGVVQLGGMSGSLTENSVDVVRRLSALGGGVSYAFYAPLVLASATAASALRRDPSVVRTSSCFPRVTVALFPVGSWAPPDSRLHDDLPPADRERLVRRGVSADVGGRLLDRAGQPVEDLDDRVLAMSLEQIRAVPHVVVVGGGARKAGAIRSVLRSGLAHTLVTDLGVAQVLLAGP